MTPMLSYGEREEEADSLFESTPRVQLVPGRGEISRRPPHSKTCEEATSLPPTAEAVYEGNGRRCRSSDAKLVDDLFSTSPFSPSCVVLTLSLPHLSSCFIFRASMAL